MSCRWCIHFICNKQIGINSSEIGECRRYPKKETVDSNYYCGEHVAKSGYPGEESLLQGFFERMHQFCDEAGVEKQKRITLEKKLRQLRKDMKK